MRIGILVEYDGTGYAGWQVQKNAVTVQEKLEKALEEMGKGKITVQGAGRTDSGVHSRGQVAHFDMDTAIPAEKFAFILNSKLPGDIRVQRSWQAPDDFHARFDACGKRYIYTIWNAPHASALYGRYSMHVPEKLDIALMRQAAAYLEGEHDFAAFCAAGSSVKSTVRTVYRVLVEKSGPRLTVSVEGNGFLYNMVRILVGTLIEVGKHKRSPEQVKAVVNGAPRKEAGMTADACGLMMDEVFYPAGRIPMREADEFGRETHNE